MRLEAHTGNHLMDNNFNTAFNFGNAQFAKDCNEPFSVMVQTGLQKGTPGTYSANSIDDMMASVTGTPGGAIQQNQVHIFISKALMASAKIVDGAVLSARGKRVRIKEIVDQGDDKVMLVCDKVGLIAQTT